MKPSKTFVLAAGILISGLTSVSAYIYNFTTIAGQAGVAGSADGTNKAANHFNAFELRPADEERSAPPGAVDGPPGPDGIRRTKTGWRKSKPPEVGE